MGHLEIGATMNIGSIPFETMKKLVIDVHKKEGIITMSWHPNSPKTNGDSWDNTAAVRYIIGNVFTKKKKNRLYGYEGLQVLSNN